MSYCYILYSKKRNRFYIGSTRNLVSNRLQIHLNKIFGKGHYTAIADDWEIFLELVCRDFSEALKIERKIKKMKSSTYIRNLKKYPELINKLLDNDI